ncbi:MAG: alpha/beta hydrolase, partial [Bacteroidota bacterium]|nr:alpha/beta hydrolase [Bacteroidota bacterium]
PDTGQVVILAHGFSVPYFIWDGTYEFLVKQGFRVLRYDMYGRGYSDRPHTVYNNDLYYNQLLELMAKLHLRSPVNLAGISFGGEMITGFTCRYPGKVNRVILLDPGYGNEAPAVPPVMTNYYEATHPDKRANGQLTDFKYPDRHPDWVKKYRVQMNYKGFRYALVSTLYNYKDNGRATNVCLNSVHKPVLLIWGKEDATVPFRFSDSIRSVLKADFLPVEDAAHLPSIEQAEKVNAKILLFLRK